MGKVKEKAQICNHATVVEEIIIPIDSEPIRKMKMGILKKMTDNLELLKERKRTPGLRVRFTMHHVDFSNSLTTDELLDMVFQDVCKKLHLKTVVFVKGQVFIDEE